MRAPARTTGTVPETLPVAQSRKFWSRASVTPNAAVLLDGAKVSVPATALVVPSISAPPVTVTAPLPKAFDATANSAPLFNVTPPVNVLLVERVSEPLPFFTSARLPPILPR